MKRIDRQRELNEAHTSMVVFAEAYNHALPAGFPKASTEALMRFRTTYPLLFKTEDSWSIDKHRKRFMDWHSTHYK